MNRKVDSLKEEALDYADTTIEKLLGFYVAEKKDLVEVLPKLIGGMISKPIMSQMGIKSGVSRQLKGLEKELITQGAGVALGNPALGGIAADLVGRYPVLKSLIPMLMQRRGQGHPDAVQTISGNGVGYGK